MIARDGGLPAPEACALCEPICPNNLATSIVDTAEALWSDINTVFKLGRICFSELGVAACVCNLFSSMRPAWIDRLPTAQQKCQGSNVFGLLVFKIVELIVRVVDDSLNQLIIDPINDFFSLLPWPLDYLEGILPRACLSRFVNPPQFNCPTGSLDESDLYACYGGKGFAAAKTCYFERQNAICTGNDDTYNAYKELFEAPNVNELSSQYREIAGDSYEFLGPTFKGLMESVASQARQPDVANAQDLCDASLFSTMDLDEVMYHLALAPSCESYNFLSILHACLNSRFCRSFTDYPDVHIHDGGVVLSVGRLVREVRDVHQGGAHLAAPHGHV
jgi:hypothetical protein